MKAVDFCSLAVIPHCDPPQKQTPLSVHHLSVQHLSVRHELLVQLQAAAAVVSCFSISVGT